MSIGQHSAPIPWDIDVPNPERVDDYLRSVSSARPGQIAEAGRLPLRLHRKKCCGRSRNELLPIIDAEINRSRWVKRQPGEIESESPVENVVEGKIAKITHTIGTRGLAIM